MRISADGQMRAMKSPIGRLGVVAWFMTFKMIDESMVFKYLLVSSCFVAVDCCDRSFALTLNMHYFPFTCLVLNTWEVSLPVKNISNSNHALSILTL